MSAAQQNRKVILYIASSLDAYIAKPDDDLSFLSMVEKEGEDYGYSQFIQTVNTIIIGRKTYDWVINQAPEFVHADKESYVITRTARPPEGNTIFYTGDLKELILRLKQKAGKNIFVDGGAEIVNELLRQNLIDEVILSIIPVLLGRGTKLFREGIPEEKLKLESAEAFESGLVQLHYLIKKALLPEKTK